MPTIPFYASASVNNGFYSAPSNLALTATGLSSFCHVGSNTITCTNAGVYRIAAVLNCVYSGTLPANPIFQFNLNNFLFSNQSYVAYDLAYNTASLSMYANTNQTLSFEVLADLPADTTVGVAIINSVSSFAISSGMLSVCSLSVASVESFFN